MLSCSETSLIIRKRMVIVIRYNSITIDFISLEFKSFDVIKESHLFN